MGFEPHSTLAERVLFALPYPGEPVLLLCLREKMFSFSSGAAASAAPHLAWGGARGSAVAPASHDAFCDGRLSCWGKRIEGVRHKCLQCSNVDFCADCAPLHTASTHHMMLPIALPQAHDASATPILEALLRPLQMVTATHPWRCDMRSPPPFDLTGAEIERRL